MGAWSLHLPTQPLPITMKLHHMTASAPRVMHVACSYSSSSSSSSSSRAGGGSIWGGRGDQSDGGRRRDNDSRRSSRSGAYDGGGRRQQQQQQQRERPANRRQWPSQQQNSRANDDWAEDYEGSRNDEYLYPPRPSKSSIMETLYGEALYGVAPIMAALRAGFRKPYALLMQEGLTGSARKDARALTEIQRLAAAAGAETRTMSKHDLNMLSGNRPHQGLILDASLLDWWDLEHLPSIDKQQQHTSLDNLAQLDEQQEQPLGSSNGSDRAGSGMQHPVWLALDEVTDPQNLGAMLRSAYCLGVSGVLACSRNCAPLSPVVSKASAGAMELMKLHSCKSMPRTIAAAVKAGWAVVGAAAEEGAVPLCQFKVQQPTLLVMGNEGYGVRPIVKRLCTQLVQIEMAPAGLPASSSEAAAASTSASDLVDSLNVSVATGILLHHMLTTVKQ